MTVFPRYPWIVETENSFGSLYTHYVRHSKFEGEGMTMFPRTAGLPHFLRQSCYHNTSYGTKKTSLHWKPTSGNEVIRKTRSNTFVKNVLLQDFSLFANVFFSTSEKNDSNRTKYYFAVVQFIATYWMMFFIWIFLHFLQLSRSRHMFQWSNFNIVNKVRMPKGPFK